MARPFALLVALAGAGCATLYTAGMSEHCRNMYNACLDGCAKSRLPPTAQPLQLGNSSNWQVEIAQCTDDCNSKAKSCL